MWNLHVLTGQEGLLAQSWYNLSLLAESTWNCAGESLRLKQSSFAQTFFSFNPQAIEMLDSWALSIHIAQGISPGKFHTHLSLLSVFVWICKTLTHNPPPDNGLCLETNHSVTAATSKPLEGLYEEKGSTISIVRALSTMECSPNCTRRCLLPTSFQSVSYTW